MDLLTFSYATLVFANCFFFFFFPLCLLIFLLLSSWSVVCLALCHWVVPNLLPGQALVACAEEEEPKEEEVTRGRLFTGFGRPGCGATFTSTG